VRANNRKGRAPLHVHEDPEGIYNACFEANGKKNRACKPWRKSAWRVPAPNRAGQLTAMRCPM